MTRAKHKLDAVQSLAAIEALDPASYAKDVIAESPAAVTIAELEARDAYLTTALQGIDDVVSRAMKIHLEHALAHDTSIGAPSRRVFAQTVASYASDLERLGDRARDLAARGGSANPAAIATTVVDAARASLDLGEELRAGVLDHVRATALAVIPDADRRARDDTTGEAIRKRWSTVRRDAEMVAEDPTRILAAPFAKRIAAWPEQLDEPAPKPEVHPSDLIELD